jgi:hypothetical protein
LMTIDRSLPVLVVIEDSSFYLWILVSILT